MLDEHDCRFLFWPTLVTTNVGGASVGQIVDAIVFWPTLVTTNVGGASVRQIVDAIVFALITEHF